MLEQSIDNLATAINNLAASFSVSQELEARVSALEAKTDALLPSSSSAMALGSLINAMEKWGSQGSPVTATRESTVHGMVDSTPEPPAANLSSEPVEEKDEIPWGEDQTTPVNATRANIITSPPPAISPEPAEPSPAPAIEEKTHDDMREIGKAIIAKDGSNARWLAFLKSRNVTTVSHIPYGDLEQAYAEAETLLK